MNRIRISIMSLCLLFAGIHPVFSQSLPWDNGRLKVDASGNYLQHENGVPFFWMGDTGWLLPERLDRQNAEKYLEACRLNGYNVVQVQTINGVPARNIYGSLSNPQGFDFSSIERRHAYSPDAQGSDPEYGYWDHMDYIIETAAEKGIYIGMVCIWGGLVKQGRMDEEQAVAYGTFLAERYKDNPNIVWIIGGDIYGDVKPEVWETLARTIKAHDPNHLMTFHPFGRHISAIWFHQADWLDFNMFQSGHRCYGQSMAKKSPLRPELLPDSTEEDNWRYVELARTYEPRKPVVDGEPSYEGIPYGLHDYDLPFWQDYDVRRYAYWSVFAGSFGHTYGNSAIMQMHDGRKMGAYGCLKPWQEALEDPGFRQMQYLKKLMLAFSNPQFSADPQSQPYFDRCPDQSLIVSEIGERYNYVSACRGKDYLLVYDYAGVDFSVDLTKISGKSKNAWWFSPTDGSVRYIGSFQNASSVPFSYTSQSAHDDRVLIVTDAAATYVEQTLTEQASVCRLECEQQTNPVGIGVRQPRFSWNIRSDVNGVYQTQYRILVASSEEQLADDRADVWDSGIRKGEASLLLPYEGPQLQSGTRYFWKVLSWTNLDKKNAVESETATFVTALFTDRDWGSSRWIGYDGAFPWEDEGTHARLSARYLRSDFMTRPGIRQALVHIAGVGLYELYFNGQKVGDQVMTPSPTQFDKHILYNTYDVTSLMKEGANAVGVILGSGRYYPMRHNYKPYKWADFGYPKMRLMLTITYEDGRTQSVTSNERWMLTAQGPIVSNNEYDGEEYDARMELGDWSSPRYQYQGHWMPAQRTSVPTARLVAQSNPSMRVLKRVRPKSMTPLNDSTFILDMGENMTGWLRIKVQGRAGQTVKLRFAEALLPDGNLSMANLRDALVTDLYTLKGGFGGEEWAPRFVTHGFQYVEVTNYPGRPSLDNFIGEWVADDLDFTGSFESPSPVFNQTYENAFRGILGNYKGMPVDCPQRNERQPWLGDRSMGVYGESFLFDNATFYAKWMDDIADAQRWDGAIPSVAPAYWNYYNDDVTWPTAFFSGCDMIFKHFGDLRPMEKHFGDMLRYLDYTWSYFYDSRSGLMTADKYGDWCMPVESPEIIHSSAPDRLTDGKLISTAYFCHLLEMMCEYAPLLDRQADVAGFEDRIEGLKKAFNEQFYNAEAKCYSNNTTTANVVALGCDMVPEEYVGGVLESVRSKIMDEYKGTMTTGVIGDQWLWRMLSRNGLNDVAWHLITTTDYPSFGYMQTKGATTIWELWNGDTADPKMNSRNHVMQLGDLLVWCYEDLLGIRSDSREVAFKKLLMHPQFDICPSMKGSLKTPYGLVQSAWEQDAEHLVWNISLPANTRAEITLPTADKKAVIIDGKPASKLSKQGIRLISKTENESVWSLPSGNHQIDLNR